MRVSVVVQYHNEIEFLPNFFEHIKSFADDVHVGIHAATDGSLEYTKNIQSSNIFADMTIQEFPPDTVHDHGFSYMKNCLLERCTGDWVVCLDADEEMAMSKETLEPFTRQKNSAISTQTMHISSSMTHWSLDNKDIIKKEADWIIQRHWRIFKNGLDIKWYGLIHEELRLPTGRHVAHLARQSNIKMYHYGALANPLKRTFKDGLYAELLLRLVENPELRNGTNRWWWTDYYETNKDQLYATREIYRWERESPHRESREPA